MQNNDVEFSLLFRSKYQHMYFSGFQILFCRHQRTTVKLFRKQQYFLKVFYHSHKSYLMFMVINWRKAHTKAKQQKKQINLFTA